MNLPFLIRLFDERFVEFRRRSTSVAGIVGAELALLLFFYRYFFNHVVSWDLFAVGAAFVVVKLALMTWFYLTK